MVTKLSLDLFSTIIMEETFVLKKKFPTNYQTVQVYSPINIITNTRNNI